MTFEMTHLYATMPPEIFDEHTAPKWLCEGGGIGSTMDHRWFWNDHVLTLKVGESTQTDFRLIRRVK